ncbi:hypothetical protein J6590_092862 [Homalodisca vitripennis]|nr:hypothetical protein J6590_092862 [Homalodisca vitripennis]
MLPYNWDFKLPTGALFWCFWRPLPISGLVLDPQCYREFADGTLWPPVRKLTRGATPWAAPIARLRRPYGPASG